MARLMSVQGIPLIGLYIRATEESAVIGVKDKEIANVVEEELDVDVVQTTIAGSELVGAMACANSNGVVVCQHAGKKEIDSLRKVFDVKVVETNMTCLGNNVILNDSGGIAHPEIGRNIMNAISDFLDVDVSTGTIGGIKTVGMAGVVTNKGGIVNPNATDWEIERLKKVMKIEVEKGTVNFGSDMVGSGIVANSKGYIAGRDTTGFELGVIESALNFL